MNLAGTIVADEADIVAIEAVNASDLGEAAPTRAIVSRDLVIDRFDIGRIGEDAAGIVAGHCRTGAGEKGAQSQRGGAAAQGAGSNHSERDYEFSEHGKASHAFITLKFKMGCRAGKANNE